MEDKYKTSHALPKITRLLVYMKKKKKIAIIPQGKCYISLSGKRVISKKQRQSLDVTYVTYSTDSHQQLRPS